MQNEVENKEADNDFCLQCHENEKIVVLYFVHILNVELSRRYSRVHPISLTLHILTSLYPKVVGPMLPFSLF